MPVVTTHPGAAAVDCHFGVEKAAAASGGGRVIAGQGPGVINEGKPLVVDTLLALAFQVCDHPFNRLRGRRELKLWRGDFCLV